MFRIYNILFILFFLFNAAFVQEAAQPQQEDINSFFKALISGHGSMEGFVLPSELEKSKRLGITYESTPDKFLISYDIEPEVKEKINKGSLQYEVREEDLGEGFTKAIFSLKGMSYKRDFFFKDGRFISPASYYTRNWKNFTTKYFSFFISDTSLFNSYSAEKLDSYVGVLSDLLKLSKSDRELLEKNKMIYILCRDNEEIEKLTGFNTKGMYMLAFDEVVTTFNCHFHELSHLLINFKLKKLPLYTLPFFQEGFSTATGGRGGVMRNVILNAGDYLVKAGYIPYNSILTKKEFSSEDASMTYPVSGLYNLFLMNELGIESYLKLYRSYSGTSSFVQNLKENSIMLPSEARFNVYLHSRNFSSGISIENGGNPGKLIYGGPQGKIYDSGKFYMVRLKGSMLLSGPEKPKGFQSKKFEELYPNKNYNGAKYLITATSRDVSVYNLYTNNLIAAFNKGFSFKAKDVPTEEGYYQFYINKDIFEEDLQFLQVSGF